MLYEEMMLRRQIKLLCVKGDIENLERLYFKENFILDSEFDGEFLLHLACVSGNIELCKWLLDNGSDVNLKNPKNKATALHYAAFQRNRFLMDFLMRRGADPDSKCKSFPPFKTPRGMDSEFIRFTEDFHKLPSRKKRRDRSKKKGFTIDQLLKEDTIKDLKEQLEKSKW